MDSPRAAQGDGWETPGEPGRFDEVLRYFLDRHAEEAIPPLGEGTGRQSLRLGAITEESDLKNGAVEIERDTKVLR